MITQHRNRAALHELIRQLMKRNSLAVDEVRQQCTRVVYTCLLLGIEPCQLPIAKNFPGTLSEEQKGEFLHHYLVLLFDKARMESTVSQLSGTESLSSLVQAIDEILDLRYDAVEKRWAME